MIEKVDTDTYVLECDMCGTTADEIFDDFEEVVEFKRNRDNGWRSRKDSNGEWGDLCPDCYKERYGYKYGRD